MKARRQPIVMVTAYDAPGGRLADQAGADLVLVGDSAAMTVLGHDSTVPATMEEMLILTRAVTRGASRPLVIADMPFGSFQVSDEDAVRNAIRFVKEAGADAVKLEGAGRDALARQGDRRRGDPGDGAPRPDAAVRDDARRLQGAGTLGGEGARASTTTRARSRRPAASRSSSRRCRRPSPRASRGSSRSRRSASAQEPDCDGQVLVWHDILGLYDGRAARFVKRYAEIGDVDPHGARRVRRGRARAPLPRGAAHVRDAGRRARGLRGRRRQIIRNTPSIAASSAAAATTAAERAQPCPPVGDPDADHERARATRRRTRAGRRAALARPPLRRRRRRGTCRRRRARAAAAARGGARRRAARARSRPSVASVGSPEAPEEPDPEVERESGTKYPTNPYSPPAMNVQIASRTVSYSGSSRMPEAVGVASTAAIPASQMTRSSGSERAATSSVVLLAQREEDRARAQEHRRHAQPPRTRRRELG